MASLLKTVSQAPGRKGQRPGLDRLEMNAVRKAAVRGLDPGPLDIGRLHVDADDLTRAVGLGKQKIDPTHAAADVEHRGALEIEVRDHAGDFIRPAGRKETSAPDDLQGLDQGLAVFRFI